jgi:hypothetical protein
MASRPTAKTARLNNKIGVMGEDVDHWGGPQYLTVRIDNQALTWGPPELTAVFAKNSFTRWWTESTVAAPKGRKRIKGQIL